MHLTSAVAADLYDFTTTLQLRPGAIQQPLVVLNHDLRLAIPSYLGFELTTCMTDQLVTASFFEVGVGCGDVKSSLRIPLDTLVEPDHPSLFVLFAGRPDALRDLAEKLSRVLRTTHGPLVLDEDLEPSTTSTGLVGLNEMEVVHQAIGVLVARGSAPNAAHGDLHRQAEEAGVDVPTEARRILAEASRPPNEGAPDRRDGSTLNL